MADIFREIDEDIRRDRVMSLVRRNAGLILAALVVIVAVTAGVVVWQNWREQRFESHGLAFAQAMDLHEQGADDKAIAQLKDLAAKGGGYGLIARIQAAELEVRGPGRAGGIAKLRQIADDSSIPETYRNLVLLVWGLYAVDGEKPQTIIDAMKPLVIGATPWHYTAVEITALAQLRAGDRSAALKSYQSLADDLLAPRGLRARAAEIVSGLKS